MSSHALRHRRLHLSILIATAVLALNAIAVANGWTPFQVPQRAEQAQSSQAASDSSTSLNTGSTLGDPAGRS